MILRASKKIIKQFWQNKKNLFLIVLITTILLELALRFFQPTAFEYYRNLKEFHVYHPDYLVDLAPNADTYLKDNKGLWKGRFTTNSLGMRGSREINSEQTQVACLGDSMVMGFGVSDEQALCSLLDNQKINGNTIQTLNIAVDAFGSRGYAKKLKAISEKTKLDVVLLFVSPNDFVMPEDLQKRGIKSDDKKDEIRFNDKKGLLIFKYRFLLTQYSHLAHAIAVSAKQLIVRTQLYIANIKTELVYSGLIDYNKKIHGQLNRQTGIWLYIKNTFYKPPVQKVCKINPEKETDFLPQKKAVHNCPEAIPSFVECKAEQTPKKDLAPLFKITQKYYDEIIELSREKNFVLIPVFLPIQDQTLYCTQAGLYSPLYDFALRAKYFFLKRGVDVIEIRKYIPDMCNRKFQDQNKFLQIGDYYIHGDGHYTVEGNRWAAESLFKELNKIKYVF